VSEGKEIDPDEFCVALAKEHIQCAHKAILQLPRRERYAKDPAFRDKVDDLLAVTGPIVNEMEK